MTCRRDLVQDLTLAAAWCELVWPVLRDTDIQGIAAPLTRGGTGMTLLAARAPDRILARQIEETAGECLHLLGYYPLPFGNLQEHGDILRLTAGPRSAHDRARALRYFRDRGMAIPPRSVAS